MERPLAEVAALVATPDRCPAWPPLVWVNPDRRWRDGPAGDVGQTLPLSGGAGLGCDLGPDLAADVRDKERCGSGPPRRTGKRHVQDVGGAAQGLPRAAGRRAAIDDLDRRGLRPDTVKPFDDPLPR